MRIESRHGWVEVVEQTLAPKFVIVGSSGYRAELDACPCDLPPCEVAVPRGGRHRIDGKAPGPAWSRHCAERCHGMHWPRAEAFARKVLATYGVKVKTSMRTYDAAA